MNYNLDIEKEDMTLKAFFGLCKSTCKYKNIPFTFDMDKFIKGEGPYIHYYNDKTKDPNSHVHVERPYEYISYKVDKNGVRTLESYCWEASEEDPKICNGHFHVYVKNS